MKSSILVSRIIRAVETDGGVGDGASLAEAYAQAVLAVNRRLEGVQAALDAKQGSDAVRLLEAEPRLLDEAGTLDFFQLPEWQELCSRCGWAVPERVDQALLERVLEVAGSAAMVEPALKMYRRAMRMHDEELTLQSLRRLAASDKSSDWAKELRQAEGAAQRRLLDAFRKARAASDESGMAQATDALLDEKWSAPPEEGVLREPAAFRREKDELRRKMELSEDLGLLKKLASDWKRERAEALLRHLDSLTLAGLSVPSENEAEVAAVRERCVKEAAEAEAEERWRAAVEQLHVAVAHGDPDEIRSVLASPEFLDRPPDEELQTRAEMAIAQAEDAHRRKVRLLAFCLVFVLLGVLLLAGKVYAQRQFDARCVAESARLAQLCGASRAHETLKAALDNLEKESPRVRQDPRIKAYETKLAEITDARNRRLAEANGLLERLDAEQAAGWPGEEEENRMAIETLKGLILPEDDELSKRLPPFELSFQKTCAARHADLRERAAKELKPVLDAMTKATEICRREFPSGARLNAVSACRKKAEAWQSSYSDEVPASVPRLDAALAELDAAFKRMNEAAHATNELAKAADMDGFLRAREVLTTGYGDYRGVGALRSAQIDETGIRLMMEGGLPGQRRFVAAGNDNADETFARVAEDALEFREVDSWYSLYGVGDNNKVYAYHVGRPETTTEYTSTGSFEGRIRGVGILDAENLQKVNAFSVRLSSRESWGAKLTPVSAELQELVDFANQARSDRNKFCSWLLARLKMHLKAAKGDSFPVEVEKTAFRRTSAGGYQETRKKSYLEQESSDSILLRPGRFPAYARVQIMNQYLEWLETLGELPERIPGPSGWRAQLSDLAAPISVEGVDGALVWTCLAEPRVRTRNRKCAEFLNKLPVDLFDQIHNAKAFDEKLREVSTWKAAFVGSFMFLPERPDGLVPVFPSAVGADHPLYVLRKENGNTLLKKALVPSRKNPGAWAFAPGAKEMVKQGEPLFEVRRAGEAFDPEPVVAALLTNAPNGSERIFSNDSFWIEIAAKKVESSEAK